MKKRIRILMGLMLLGLSGVTQAALFDRGGGMIYDDVLDITWLQDANQGGSMNWDDSVAWAGALEFGGFDDWRLASMDVNGDNTIINCNGASEVACRDNELGYMFYQNLMGSFFDDLTGDQAELTQVSLKSASGRSSLVMDGVYPVLETIDLRTASGSSDVILTGDYPALRTLKIGSASGKVSVRLSGSCPVLDELDVGLASGKADLDLAGATLPHGKVKLSCVSGKAVVIVPTDSPVVINFTTLSGKLVAPGFEKRGKDHVNAAYIAAEAGAEAEAGVEDALRLSMSSVSSKLVVQSPEA